MEHALALVKRAIAGSVAPILRTRGFRGSWPTWTLTNDLGDVALVNVQSGGWRNSADSAVFYVNVAVVPRPWREWEMACWGGPRRTSLNEADGLYRDKLGGGTGSWTVTDEASARLAAVDVADRLLLSGLPAIESLLKRSALLEALRYGRVGMFENVWSICDVGLAVLLAEEGPGDELTRVMASLLEQPSHTETWPEQRAKLVIWVEERAGRLAP